MLLRILCLPLAGTEDVQVWKNWAYGATRDVTGMYGVGGTPPVRGVVVWGDARTTVDYPPATLYALGAVGRVYRIFDPAFRDGVGLTVAIKAAILAGDLLVLLFLFTLLRWRYGDGPARLAALGFWINPGVLFDGAVLGYLDSWAAAPAIAAIAAADAGAAIICGATMMVAVLIKAQAIFLVPVGAIVLWNRARTRAVAAAAASGVATGALLLAPYAWRGALPNVFQAVRQLTRHDMLSGTAANLWWIVTWVLRAIYAIKDLGVWASWTMTVRILGISRVVALGYPNPRPMATAVAAVVMLWAFWRARRAPLPMVLAAGAFAVHAYFVLAVQVHENHLYMAVPVMAGAASLVPSLRGPYVLVSLVVALNLFLFYGIGRGYPLPPRGFTIVDATVVLSFVNVGALVWHGRRFSAASKNTIEAHSKEPAYFS